MIARVRRYPWTIAFAILFIAMSVGFFRVENIQDDVENDRIDRAQASLIHDQQFCMAIPNVAETGVRVLVDAFVARLERQGAPISEINALKARGERYVASARRLAISDLPECEIILSGRVS